MTIEEQIDFDKRHIWHPYASATNTIESILVKSASGVFIELENGTKLIDGMSSWWSVIHGYNNQQLNNAAKLQIDKMAHVMFGGLTHSPAIDLAKKLIEIVPNGLEHVFYSDSGSVAVEVAMKMALQYFISLEKPNKKSFVTIKNGYHGDTWHAMSVCDHANGMHSIFNGKLPFQYFLPAPKSKFGADFDDSEIKEVEELLYTENENIAAFVLEPILQGAGGMRFYHQNYLKRISELCKKYDVLLITDEIATGFGRTGKLFACEHSNIVPDIMCLGKAITGGYMSFAATLCTKNIAEVISNNSPGVFMHGPTFMANPLACAIANESINLLLKTDWEINLKRIEYKLQNLQVIKKNNAVKDVRILGAVGVVELNESVDMKIIQKHFVENGIWIRPFGNLIYTMPPYIITNDELDKLTNAIIKTIDEVYG